MRTRNLLLFFTGRTLALRGGRTAGNESDKGYGARNGAGAGAGGGGGDAGASAGAGAVSGGVAPRRGARRDARDGSGAEESEGSGSRSPKTKLAGPPRRSDENSLSPLGSTHGDGDDRGTDGAGPGTADGDADGRSGPGSDWDIHAFQRQMRNVGAAGDRHGDHVKGFLAGGAYEVFGDIPGGTGEKYSAGH